MSFVRQSLRTRPPFGELGDPPLPQNGTVLYEEEYCRQPIADSIPKQTIPEEPVKRKDRKPMIKTSSSKELAYADHVERLMIEATVNKKLQQQQRRRPPSALRGANSYRIDKLLQDENNDWFFEKILEKFENIRSRNVSNRLTKSSSNTSNNDAVHGVERIVERRYYVKKPPALPKRDQLTSTTDLTRTGKKSRLLSGVSTATAATTSCSQCSSSTPTFVENLRDQSDSLRNDIVDLKSEIEQLQTSQQEFFHQLRSEIQSKTAIQAIPQNSARTTNSSLRSSAERNVPAGNTAVPVISGERSRSTSTESLTSASTTSSGSITPTPQTTAKLPPMAPPQSISEFTAYKNPSYTPMPTVNPYSGSKPPLVGPTPPVNTSFGFQASSVIPTPPINTSSGYKPPSVVPTPPMNPYGGSKPSSVAPTPPANTLFGSKPSSIAPSPSMNPYGSSKPSSAASTPPINAYLGVGKVSSIPSMSTVTESVATEKPYINSAQTRSVSSRQSSTASTPRETPAPKPSTGIPTYENELAHRRILSPRSQIVASSASIVESSTSSSNSISPVPTEENSHNVPKASTSTLRDHDLKDLVQYSSHLELSGFPSSTTAVITNPNTSSTFWDSVDDYIENSKSTNVATGLPSIPRAYYGNSYGLSSSTTKQLDKYDLEIKPQETFTSSAPLLMPPLDISP